VAGFGIPASGRSPDQHHAGPADAGHEPLLRGRAAPAWEPRGVCAALRGWALRHNFRPWHPATARANGAGAARRSGSTSTAITTAGCRTSWCLLPWADTAAEITRPTIRDGQFFSTATSENVAR
jgi:hypothetical protein